MSAVQLGAFGNGHRSGALWFLLVAIACSLAGAYLVVRAVEGARREVPALVAQRTVSPLARIVGGDVALVRVPAAALPSGALRSVAQVRGKFTRLGLAPGEIVTSASLLGASTGSSRLDVRLGAAEGATDCSTSATGAIPPGTAHSATTALACRRMVAMTLPLSQGNGFAMVRTGDTVDVVAGYASSAHSVSQVVAADVPVLAVEGGQPAGGLSSGASGDLVLAVTPEQALRLQFVESGGHVSILLEPPGAPPEPPQLTEQVVDGTALLHGGQGVASAPSVAGILPPAGEG